MCFIRKVNEFYNFFIYYMFCIFYKIELKKKKVKFYEIWFLYVFYEKIWYNEKFSNFLKFKYLIIKKYQIFSK